MAPVGVLESAVPTVAVVAALLVAVAGLVVLVMLCAGKKKRGRDQNGGAYGAAMVRQTSGLPGGFQMQGVNASYVPMGVPTDVSVLRSMEFKRDELTLSRDLGEGRFGMVLEGEVGCTTATRACQREPL